LLLVLTEVVIAVGNMLAFEQVMALALERVLVLPSVLASEQV